jgi:uncharacterized protein
MKVAISGAGGFVGTHLQQVFSDCVAIKRNDTHEVILQKLENVDVVINLAGAPIIKRWTKEYKKVLFTSRIETTKKLVEAVNASGVRQFINASAVGVYKNALPSDEDTTDLGDDFLAGLVKEWEAQAKRCTKKTTILRFGVIFGRGGGALKMMLLPFKLGIGGPIADGKMMTSWIAMEDLVRIFTFVIDQGLEGVFNATSPYPVSNYEFTKALGRALHRPTVLPVPKFALKLLYGEAASVLIDSKEVYPRALQQAGFHFSYPKIQSALTHILS